jgi:hypothetical protein
MLISASIEIMLMIWMIVIAATSMSIDQPPWLRKKGLVEAPKDSPELETPSPGHRSTVGRTALNPQECTGLPGPGS